MSDLRKDIIGVIVAVAIVFITAIISITVYYVNDRALMSKNIDAAIAKGVDPVAVEDIQRIVAQLKNKNIKLHK